MDEHRYWQALSWMRVIYRNRRRNPLPWRLACVMLQVLVAQVEVTPLVTAAATDRHTG